jgi:hypothetical protein
VEINQPEETGIHFNPGYHCEVRGTYVHDSTMAGSGGGYGTLLEYKTTLTLVEDNISKNETAAYLVDDGSVGNVVSYNYVADQKYYQPNWLMGDFDSHSPHPMFNLFEGNVGFQAYMDDIHGSASHETFFRNRISGYKSSAQDHQNFALAFDAWNYYMNAVGNVLGTAGTSPIYLMNGSNFAFTNTAIFAFGYGPNAFDPKTEATFYMNGNFDYANNATQWNPGASDHSLPPSLFRAQVPAWWPSPVLWPPIGPDHPAASTIPAQVRYQSGSY